MPQGCVNRELDAEGGRVREVGIKRRAMRSGVVALMAMMLLRRKPTDG